jgi:hypothetical protein
MVFSNNLLLGAAGAGAGYTIDQSIRFDSVRNSDLTRTLSGDGNLETGTFSFWMKRSGLGSLQEIFTTYSIRSSFFFNSNDTLSMQIYNGASYTTLTTTAVFRDPSAFAHYLFRWDTTQATDTDRLQFYYNGVLQTVTGAYPAQNSTTTFSDATYTHVISGDGPANTLYEIDGYLAEIHYVDGTALAATDFGEYNSDGVWIPIEASPTYGTNGFYITGETASDLGEDFSGNNNDFTSSGLATTDQMLDTPTLNYCTLNPLITPATMTFADGNLALSGYTAVTSAYGTFGMSSGKWYWELVAQTNAMAGVAATPNGSQYPGQAADSYSFDLTNGTKYNNGSSSAFGAGAVSAGNTVGVAFDADNGDLKFYDNSGTLIGTAYSGLTSGPYFPVFRNGSAANISINFGQQTFSHSLPASHVALSTANLATPSITDGSAHFQPTLYTGTGSSLAVTQSGNSTFQPDWVWIKGRSGATEHVLTDAVRGVTKELSSNDTGAEETVAQGLTAFGSAGFTVGTDGSYNTSSATYVGWQWKANGAGSSNTDGTISSTVSANTTSGFSIVSYAGNLSTTGSATVGHGLGIAPSVVISKSLDSTAGDSGAWAVQHTSLAASNILRLNTTDATSDKSGNGTLSSPTSTVFYTNYTEGLNVTGNDYIAYCFAEVEGFSKLGSYTGNGSANGPFIYTGFAPEFIMVKSSSNSGTNWDILDATRETFNTRGNQLVANSSAAEASNDHECDFLSNGFKWRDGSGSNNGSGYTIIYMAFAKHPFGGDGVAPATAR